MRCQKKFFSLGKISGIGIQITLRYLVLTLIKHRGCQIGNFKSSKSSVPITIRQGDTHEGSKAEVRLFCASPLEAPTSWTGSSP